MIQHELKFTEGTKMKILIKKCNNSTTNTISTKWKNKKKKKEINTQHLLLSRIPTCFVGHSRLHYSCLPQFCDSLV